MSATISKLSIYNGALIELGQSVLSSLSDGDSGVIATLNAQYDKALRITLKAQNWDFASAYARPNLISDAANDTPYQYQYQLPNDFLKFQRVMNADKDKTDYENIADGLYTDANPVIIKYTKLITNEAKFDDDFANLLSFNLAELCAEEIAGSTQKEALLGQKTEKLEAVAASQSVGKSSYKYDILSGSDYLNVRR